jgi:hypothetical protein
MDALEGGTMDTEDLSLSDALAGARSADRLTRISWRDRIAIHGRDAIEAVSPWVEDREFGAFAVRVIEATAKFGSKEDAIDALLSVARYAPNAVIGGDIEQALDRLRPKREPADKAKAAGGRHLSARAGLDWPGFKETDFEGVNGTSWRRSHDPIGMVPLVLRPLQELDPNFGSWAIYRCPEVHIANRERYQQIGEWKQGWRASKLVVYAHGPSVEHPDDEAKVAAGWYIEKGDGGMEYGPVDRALWDWPAFIELIADPVRRAPLAAAAVRHGFRFGDYFGGRYRPEGATLGFVAELAGGRLAIRSSSSGAQMGEGWDSLAERLAALPADRWHDFHVWREWPAQTAIAAGQPFAVRELLPVLRDLARVYLDVI